MNYTLLIVVILLLLSMIGGFKRGMAKEISGMIALAATLFVLALLLMLFSSFKAMETTNTLYSIILLVILGVVYAVIKLLLKSAQAISKLPILNLLDHLLGIVAGAIKGILVIWLIFMFCTDTYCGPITSIIRNDIEESTFLQLIYSYNFFPHLTNIF